MTIITAIPTIRHHLPHLPQTATTPSMRAAPSYSSSSSLAWSEAFRLALASTLTSSLSSKLVTSLLTLSGSRAVSSKSAASSLNYTLAAGISKQGMEPALTGAAYISCSNELLPVQACLKTCGTAHIMHLEDTKSTCRISPDKVALFTSWRFVEPCFDPEIASKFPTRRQSRLFTGLRQQ